MYICNVRRRRIPHSLYTCAYPNTHTHTPGHYIVTLYVLCACLLYYIIIYHYRNDVVLHIGMYLIYYIVARSLRW